MPFTLPVTAVLGAGSMARAIVLGLLGSGAVAPQIRTTNRSERSAAAYAGLAGVEARSLVGDPTANTDAVRGAEVILLGVKPYQVVALLREIAPVVARDVLVVSLAGGIPIATLARELPAGVDIVRTAPNTPSLVGRGMTGIAVQPGISAAHRTLAFALFACVGEVLEVEEAQLATVGTISGSGPAYFYYLVEQLTLATVELGFGTEDAQRLVESAFVGAGELLRVTGETPAELRRQVTSPGGSTERAIAVLADADLGALFGRSARAAIARLAEMGADTP